MPQQDPSRTEKATPKRRNKQRQEGHVPRGAEMAKTVVLLVGVVALRHLIEFIYVQQAQIYRWFLGEGMRYDVNQESVYSLFAWALSRMAFMVLPFMLIIAFTAWLSQRLQVGKLWTTKVFKFKWERFLNILGGIKNIMASPAALMRFGRSLLQALVVGIAPYIVLKQELPNLLPLFDQTTEAVAASILTMGYKMTCYALVPMMLIAIADLWYTRWDYEEQIKMTKDEIKDEHRQAEGDPKIKAAQRQKMMAVMAQRMLADVPKADVVVTNPTHIAVALSYNIMEAPAPKVLAKGVDHMAEKIKEIARENNVPIREDKPLAQALYKQVEIGEMIPEDLFKAVAAILARLDKFRKRK